MSNSLALIQALEINFKAHDQVLANPAEIDLDTLGQLTQERQTLAEDLQASLELPLTAEMQAPINQLQQSLTLLLERLNHLESETSGLAAQLGLHQKAQKAYKGYSV